MADAHVGVKAGHDDCIDAELLEEDVEVGLEESAVAAFGNDIVLVAKFKLGDDLGSGGACHGVLAPDLEFAVDLRQVAVIAEDDGDAGFAGSVEKFSGGGNDVDGPFTSEGAVNEVLKHVDNQHSSVIEDQRFLGVFHFCYT